MTEDFARRRAIATVEIEDLCARILKRVADGPNHRQPTDKQDALRFEAIVADLQVAYASATRL